ncbi:MAG TPA: hypothetical protein VM658_05665 [bacterium]|nr:hypothetical protein [bacterium]
MPRFFMICLAHSRKHGGRCIAGLRADGQGWIRPVTADGGPLQREHYRLDDGSEPRLLDLISIECSRPAPDPLQPENWAISGQPWQLLKRPAPPAMLSVLSFALSAGPYLFGSRDDRVPRDRICRSSRKRSLELIVPQAVQEWYVNDRKQARVKFNLKGARYDLSVTDIIWEERIKKSGGRIGGIADGRLMFTVSLGRPFKDDCCYKLVAGIVAAPEVSSED